MDCSQSYVAVGIDKWQDEIRNTQKYTVRTCRWDHKSEFSDKELKYLFHSFSLQFLPEFLRIEPCPSEIKESVTSRFCLVGWFPSFIF